MIRWQRFVLTAAVVLLVGLSSASARASVTLDFTDQINFIYTGGTGTGAGNGNIAGLSAQVTFSVSGQTLTIVVNNTSSTAEITGVFFNAPNAGTFSNVSSSSIPAQNPLISSNVTAGGQADGFGSFDQELLFGSGQNARLNTSTVATVTATFSGSISDADLKTTTHSNTYGNNAGVIDWKPLVGLTGFGSGNPGSPQQPNPVPEPSTIALALSGLVGFGLAGLRRFRRAVA